MMQLIFKMDPQTYVLTGNEYINIDDETACDYEMDYLIFYCSELNCNNPIGASAVCLEDNEMNFYYLSEFDVIHNKMRIEYSKPDNWVNKVAIIEGVGELVGSQWIIRHKNSLKYANRYLQGDEYFVFQPITNIE